MAHLEWLRGGEATLLALTADAIALDSTTPSPPGSRIDGRLLVGSAATLRVKIHLSRRESSGRFRLEGRPIDMTRELRLELEAIVASASISPSGSLPGRTQE